MERASGVLMHITSLPNRYGIGSFGEIAYKFVDFLTETKQTYWQILPLTTTSYGDSPYQSFSAFAGNTHLIDLDQLIADGLLVEDDVESLAEGNNLDTIDYAKVFHERRPVLEKAVKAFIDQGKKQSKDYQDFLTTENEWLQPFVEYMSIKENFALKAWYEWPDEYKFYNADIVNAYLADHPFLADYHRITQFLFYKQWLRLKQYANDHHIQIIGDMPIYVSADSVEMWRTPEMFKVDENLNPIDVSGCPPDAFTSEGQYWGNPIYDWEYMAENNYSWWIKRIKASLNLYDVVRIDHFRGFESYWAIPFGSPTAAYGRWEKGPDYALFEAIHKALGDVNIIAEDLGFMTDEVIELREKTGFPGMKILQFGFSNDPENTDLPHYYTENTIAYVGTHDNETAEGWYMDSADSNQQKQADNYLHRHPGESISYAMNRGIAESVSHLAIYQMQDLLHLDNRARMNIPSTIGNNWKWRMRTDAITPFIKNELLYLTETYYRMNNKMN